MEKTPKEILNFIEENDVKFIRLTFTDIYGNLKNIAIMPSELPRAFEHGIPFDAGFLSENYSDLLLFPDISTLSVLPWRPRSGRVIRFFCNVKCTDGTHYTGDLRYELGSFLENMENQGYSCRIGTKCEFYLFDNDEYGKPTKIPHDNAGYLDIAPLDRCENPRREICLSLEEMGFNPQSSRHTYGPGQNEIDFKMSGALTAADNMLYYKTVVKNIAAQHGLFASFMPMPIENQFGSGLHIGISVKKNGQNIFSSSYESFTDEGKYFYSGIASRLSEITCFLNPTTNSYKRLNKNYNEKYAKSKFENRSRLIRIPYAADGGHTMEVRSADAACDPYIAFKLLLAAGLEGINRKILLNENDMQKILDSLPRSLNAAVSSARASEFVRNNISSKIYEPIFRHFEDIITRYELSDDKNRFEDEFYFTSI